MIFFHPGTFCSAKIVALGMIDDMHFLAKIFSATFLYIRLFSIFKDRLGLVLVKLISVLI